MVNYKPSFVEMVLSIAFRDKDKIKLLLQHHKETICHFSKITIDVNSIVENYTDLQSYMCDDDEFMNIENLLNIIKIKFPMMFIISRYNFNYKKIVVDAITENSYYKLAEAIYQDAKYMAPDKIEYMMINIIDEFLKYKNHTLVGKISSNR